MPRKLTKDEEEGLVVRKLRKEVANIDEEEGISFDELLKEFRVSRKDLK